MIGEQSRSTTPSTNEADVVHLSTKNHDLAAYATKNLITYGDTPMAFEWLGLSLLIQPGTVLYQIIEGVFVSSQWVLDITGEGAIRVSSVRGGEGGNWKRRGSNGKQRGA